MSDITFAKPRHEYHSYRDFWTMVKLCGYPVCWMDEMDIHSDRTYIFTGPDATHEFKGAMARIIYWLLEWYMDYKQRTGVAETWVSNKTYAEIIGAKYVPMGGHPELGTLSKGAGEYDIAHMSYDGIHRRGLMINKIKALGPYTIAPNAWFSERDYNLRNSMIMLHIHQDKKCPAIAPLRAVLAAAYGLPLIAENGWSTDPYTDYVYAGAYKDLPGLVQRTLDATNLKERGRAFHDYVCNDLRFDKMVEGAL